MTLIVGLACREGLVIASDSQSTADTSGQPTKGHSVKLHSAWDNVVWGSSGTVGLCQRVREELEKTYPQRNRFAKDTRAELRKKIASAVSKIVRDLFQSQYLSPQLSGIKAPQNSFLFVACASDGPLILEIAPNLLDEEHMHKGYCAIGSGDIFPYYAFTSLAHMKVKERTLLEAKMIAYRIVDDAIRVAAFGLGGPIQMYEITNCVGGLPAQTNQLSKEDLEIVADKVSEWKSVESETLEQVVGMRSAEAIEDEEVAAPAAEGETPVEPAK